MQEICKPSTFYKFPQCYLMVASFNLSKSLFRFRKLLQSKHRGRSFVGKFDRSKTPTVCFSEIIDCDWSKKHVTNSHVF